MLKKWFDWTPRDLAYWDKLRRKGLGRFILYYGLFISAGLLFLIFGLTTFVFWLMQLNGHSPSLTSWLFLAGQLLFTALVCLIFGVINSLLTWVVEERLYSKYKSKQKIG